MHRLLGDMKAQPNAWPFSMPVNGEEVVDYYEVIKRPMGQSCPNPPPGIRLTFPCRPYHHGAQAKYEPIPKSQDLFG